MSITKDRKTELIGQYKRGDADTGSPEVQVALLTADQRAERALQAAQEGPRQPAGPPEDGQQALHPARLPPGQGSAPVSGADPEPRVAKIGRIGLIGP